MIYRLRQPWWPWPWFKVPGFGWTLVSQEATRKSSKPSWSQGDAFISSGQGKKNWQPSIRPAMWRWYLTQSSRETGMPGRGCHLNLFYFCISGERWHDSVVDFLLPQAMSLRKLCQLYRSSASVLLATPALTSASVLSLGPPDQPSLSSASCVLSPPDPPAWRGEAALFDFSWWLAELYEPTPLDCRKRVRLFISTPNGVPPLKNPVPELAFRLELWRGLLPGWSRIWRHYTAHWTICRPCRCGSNQAYRTGFLWYRPQQALATKSRTHKHGTSWARGGRWTVASPRCWWVGGGRGTS